MFWFPVCLYLAISVNEGTSFQEQNYAGMNLIAVPSPIPLDTEKIYLNDNNIPQVSSDVFFGLTTLFGLDMSNNVLTVFPYLVFVAATLIHLKLEENNIVSVPAEHLNTLTKLQVIGLGRNYITSLPDQGGIWQPSAMTNLQELDVSQNKLETMEVLCDHNQDLTMSLDSNPIVCNQRIAWLLASGIV